MDNKNPNKSNNWLSEQECNTKGFCYHELDESGNILTVNQHWQNFSGYNMDEVLGKFAGNYVSNATIQNIQRNFPILKDYGEVNSVYFSFIKQDGSSTDVLLFGRSEYDNDDRFVKTHCWFVPVSYLLKGKENLLEILNFIEESQDRTRDKFNHSKWLINTLDSLIFVTKGRVITQANKAALEFFNCQNLAELNQNVPDETLSNMLTMTCKSCHKKLLTGPPCFSIENPTTKKTHYFDCQASPIEHAEGEDILVLNDITEANRIRAELSNQKERSLQYLDVAKVMMVGLDPKGNINLINQAGAKLLGYSKSELLGKNWFELMLPKEERDQVYQYFLQLMADDTLFSEGFENYENHITTKNGERRLLSWKNALLKDEFGHTTGLLSSAEDVTEIRASQNELNFLAHHDTLTKLDNRQSMEIRLDQIIKQAKRNNSAFGICFIDLDNFKFVNDSYGHSTGDELLVAVAERITNTVRESDTVVRFGGDEFIIIVEDIENVEHFENVAKKLIRAFKQPVQFSEYKMPVTMSMGLSFYPQDADNIESLVQTADIAMYEAKRKGKNQYALYDPKMSSIALKRAKLQQEMVTGLQEKQFTLYYQPQVDQINQEVVGIEALVRWQHPHRGLVLPEEFIDVAETAGLIIPLGEQVLRQACEDIAFLHDNNHFNGYVSVNISGVQIEHKTFMGMVKEVLEDTQIDPKLLEMEITESVVMSAPDHWSALFKQLKSIGLKIAIDDFGTGYSSLSHLSKLPLDKIKIDKSFIHQLKDDEKARTVTQAIINLSNSMNMVSIAEGIETKEQQAFLAEQNCHIGQGYLFAKPMTRAELTSWLSTFDCKTA